MNHFYRRLAFTNMKNNKQFYLPYMFTSVISVMLFYCISALSLNEGFRNIRGASEVIMVMRFGTIIIAIFVTILIFYTNSYIMKRRKKELGVYNILGMEKKHLSFVLSWEIVSTFVVAVGVGIVLGIAFHKYFSMILYKITDLDETIPFYICADSCIRAIILFGGIYVLNLLYNILQIRLTNPIELLHSSNAGEREPKTKIFMTIIGIVSLSAGYYMALSVENPITAINLFFVAVLLVIIGTYALFTSGSITLLKLLRKNKNYYYQTQHFTSVSGMLYRMKQNAVGLGNICILSTMVLVVLTSTISMYVGLGDFVDSLQTTDINVSVDFAGIPSENVMEQMKQDVKQSIVSQNRTLLCDKSTLDFSFIGIMEGDEIIYGGSLAKQVSYTESIFVEIMTKQEYEKRFQETLDAFEMSEVVVFSEEKYEKDSLTIQGLSYQVARAEVRQDKNQFSKVINDSIIAVVNDEEIMKTIYERLCSVHIEDSIIPVPYVIYNINFDIDGDTDEKLEAVHAIKDSIQKWDIESEVAWDSPVERSKVEYYQEYLISNGGIFFLGLFLGFMFLMITVLIIYYKQVSEGYEDRERFQIMQKVGMSSREVKDTIQSQVRTVFFLPLITANIHLLVAFPMIKKIMEVMFISNTSILVGCMIGTVVVFAVIYYFVFRITSKSYIKIVGNHE